LRVAAHALGRILALFCSISRRAHEIDVEPIRQRSK
jgi:hypothetical protein